MNVSMTVTTPDVGAVEGRLVNDPTEVIITGNLGGSQNADLLFPDVHSSLCCGPHLGHGPIQEGNGSRRSQNNSQEEAAHRQVIDPFRSPAIPPQSGVAQPPTQGS
ncbi:MAG: hypothetical protein PVJ33_17455 [Lysobacterales bacterium]